MEYRSTYGTLDLTPALDFARRPPVYGEVQIACVATALAVLAAGWLMGKSLVPTALIAVTCGFSLRLTWAMICAVYARVVGGKESRLNA